MRLNESGSGFFGSGDRFGRNVLDLLRSRLGSDLASDLLFLLGGGTDESNRDMAGALEDRTGGPFGPWLETAESRASANDGFLDDERRSIEREIVFRIRDGGLERLANELRGFLRSEGQNIKGARYCETLNFTGDVARLLGRESDKFSGAFDFHGRRT